MFDVAPHEVLIFFRQAGLATAGAACFWGLVILGKAYRTGPDKSALANKAALQLLYLFFGGVGFYAFSWIVLAYTSCAFCISAHEGISREITLDELALSAQSQTPFFIFIILITAFSFLIFLFRKNFFLSKLALLYSVSFAIITALMVYPWIEYESFGVYLSSALHNWHSILTIGSVIAIDFLYLAKQNFSRDFLNWLFPLVTKGIWIGLGLDFLSAAFVFHEAFEPSSRILFMQTVIGILIINGVVLSGPLARKMLSAKSRIGFNLRTAFAFFGSLSIVSWSAITFLDGTRSISLSYWEMFAFYTVFILLAFFAHMVIERLSDSYLKTA